MTSNPPLYLVDGSGYIFRAFYAIAPLSNSKGLPTNAIVGFTRMLSKLLRDVSAEFIAVAFDMSAPTFRHEMYKDYKANRAECPADLVKQMPYFRDVVRALNISCLEKPGVEADDIIATLAVRMQAPNQPIVIVSGDKDLCQLVNDRVEVWDAMRDVHYDRDGVAAKFGVMPEQIVDYLTLTGDSSDNVPGVKGIGPKTAQQLLAHFGTVDKMMEDPAKITEISGLRGAAGIRDKILAAKGDIQLSRDLVVLKTDVDPYSASSSIEEFAWSGPDASKLQPLLDELEMNLPVDFGSVKVGRTPRAIAAKAEKRYELVTEESFAAFAAALEKVPAFAFDTETTSLDPFGCDLVGMSFSWEPHTAYYLPLGGAGACLDAEVVRRRLGPIFADPKVRKAGANLKFDIQVLAAQGYQVEGLWFDTMIASYVLTPDRRQHGLKELAKVHLHETMTTFDEVLGDYPNIGAVPVDAVAKYAGHDADATWQLVGVLDPLLEKAPEGETFGPRWIFEHVEMPLVPVLAAMEEAGIKVDPAALDVLGREFTADLAALEEKIFEHAGCRFNLNSPKQLSAILFEKLAIPTEGVKRTQSAYSTDASVLEMLAPEYEICARILEYREVFKLNSTYVEALKGLIQPRTGRIHTSFNQTVAATGRLSSSEPNLQNIPVRNARGRRIREAFIPEPGCVFLSADYSQIELRILAHLSGDENLQAAFHRGEDIHLATAKHLLLRPDATETEIKEMRRVAKTINFGIVYGMSAFRLSNELGISRREAQQFISGYFKRYPRVERYFAENAERAETRGYVETLFGRRRYLRDIDTSGRDAGYAARSLMNAPIQGTAADVIKIAMVKVYDQLREYGHAARLVLQVHDELVVEVVESKIEQIQNVVVKGMEEAVTLSVPLKVDVRLAKKWG